MQSPTNNTYTPKLTPTTKRHAVWPYIIIAVWIVLAILIVQNKNNIYDWWRLNGYSAPADITSLAQQDTMTPYAMNLFKVNHPQILDTAEFNKYCPNDGGEKTIVLGCYHSGEAGIYLLNVSDPRLNGVEQVTAAHELLHAAYNRLSTSMREQVDGWLLDYYNHDLTDPRIKATIAEYKKTEPGQVVNEMHSVFGTEVMNLPTNLENYYKRYFTNRQKIASYASQYQSEFTSRQNEVTQDDAELSTMLAQINSLKASLSVTYNQIVAEQNELNSLRQSNSISQYNSLVGPYNKQVDNYNSQVDTLRNAIDSYNTLVAQRNAAALIENQLYSELSGSPGTVPNK